MKLFSLIIIKTIIDNLPQLPGIYCIENLFSHKIYIGSSDNIRNRIYNHIWHLERDCHCNSYLQNSFNKHTGRRFIYFVLELCDESKLIEREQLYLDTFLYAQKYIETRGADKRFLSYGYNLSPTAGRTVGFKHSDETIARLIELGKENWKNPEYLNNQMMVRTEDWHRDRVGKIIESRLSKREIISKKISDAVRGKKEHLKKSVLFYNKDSGLFEMEVRGIMEAAKLISVEKSALQKALNGKKRFIKDYIVKYKESDDFPKQINPITSYYKSEETRKQTGQKIAAKNSKPIVQLDLNGKLIREWGNAVEAASSLGLHAQNIGSCVRGLQTTSGGFIWKYKN